MKKQNYEISEDGFSNGESPQADQIKACRVWLKKNSEPSWTVSKGSYWLKHEVGNDVDTYISNGALLTAAVSLGLRIDRTGINGNVYVKVIPREIRKFFAERCVFGSGLTAPAAKMRKAFDSCIGGPNSLFIAPQTVHRMLELRGCKRAWEHYQGKPCKAWMGVKLI